MNPAPRGGVWPRLEAHLGSRDVARVIYGSIIGLAVVLALQAHPPPAGKTAGILFGTAIAVGLAELYSEIIGTETRTRSAVDAAQRREIAGDVMAVVLGAGFPTIFFLAAAAGLFEIDTAFSLSKWSGLGVICGYGYLAGRLSGSGRLHALLHAAAVGLVGGALIALKALLH